MSPLTLQRKPSVTPCITDREPLTDSSSDKDPGSPRVGDGTPPLSRVTERGGSFRERGQNRGQKFTTWTLKWLHFALTVIFSILPQQPVARGGVVFLWLPLTASQTAFATATAATPEQ